MSKETKIKSKGNWGLAKALTAGLIIGGAVGTGAYFIYTTLNYKQVELIKYAKPIEKKVLNYVPLSIHETNPGAAEEDRSYFLSDDGLELLKHRIENELNFGPEIYDLTSITIDDENQIQKTENGNYYPGKDTINLSSKNFREEGLKVLKKGDVESTQTEELKVELLFQVLFHEYGHFIASKYLNSSIANPVVTQGAGNYTTKWDPDFETNFVKLMSYGDEYLNKPMITKPAGYKWRSLGSVYSAADIFQRVNFGNNEFKEVEGKPWYVIAAGTEPWFDEKNPKNAVDTSKLKYLWSLDEIYTRKYEQILYNYKSRTLASDGRKTWISSNGFVNYRDDKNRGWSKPILLNQDAANYRDIVGKKQDYMADNPFKNKDKLISLMNRHEGRDDDISVILFDANGKLRIGGYTTTNSFNLKIDGKDIVTTVDQIPYLNDGLTSKSMWISDPLKISEVVGKSLTRVTLDKDGKSVETQITNVRHGKDGLVTTSRNVSGSYSDHSNNYYLDYNDNKGNVTVTIKKGVGV